MTGGSKLAVRSGGAGDTTAADYFDHSEAQQTNTDAVVAQSLRRQYPELKLTIIPTYECDFLGYAASGFAEAKPIENPHDDPAIASLTWRQYIPPARRMEGGRGVLVDVVKFGKFEYRWKGKDFLLYIASGQKGNSGMYSTSNNYILGAEAMQTDELVLEISSWQVELHHQVWVYDQGYWQKSGELYRSIQNASWDDVILDPAMKKALRADYESFFKSRDTYQGLKVPWKRGVIYHGPPGNGKTISIKAMMHELYSLDEAIPTLYVRNLVTWGGPQQALFDIFEKARTTAPCLLVFEDLDSIVNDEVRSYFLNEVDGLKRNDGILMVGSTNHLDRLDPGISKRPSRFDRKYYFPPPNFEERVAYANFWRHKLGDNDDLDFPPKLCRAIAGITDGFSFAYIQEAFVASLLSIAARADPDTEPAYDNSWRIPGAAAPMVRTELVVDHEDSDIKDLVLWKEMKKQVQLLRDELDQENRSRS